MGTVVISILAPLVAVVGWFVAHQFNVQRDRENKKRDLRVQYLLEAYRRLESAAHRDGLTPEQMTAFESAVADIQLLGSAAEVEAARKYAREHVEHGGGDATSLLSLLRSDLRAELALQSLSESALVFRFNRPALKK